MPLRHNPDEHRIVLTSKLTLSRLVDGYTLRLEQTDTHIAKLFFLYIDVDDQKAEQPVVKFYDRDSDVAIKSITTLPWEQNSYGISPGYIHDGHEIFCLECAKEAQFENWGSIEMCDVTHTGRHECSSMSPCGNWVGDQCNNQDAECTEYAGDEDGSWCSSCCNAEIEDVNWPYGGDVD